MRASEQAARVYLEDAIARADPPMTMAELSRAVGKNHAYIQQYIKTGKPRWLPETVRDAVAELLHIDGAQLRPPPVKLRQSSGNRARRKGEHEAQVNAPRYGQIVDDPGTLELLELWNRITDPGDRELTKRILRTMADRALAVVA